MINYEEMSDDELDLLAGKSLGWRKENMIGHGLSWVENEYPKIIVIMPFEAWHPTRPDSNQTERYLFKMLIGEHGCRITTGDDINDFNIDIYDSDVRGKKICWVETVRFDDINRTKTIACLMAWEKLEK